MRGGTRQRQDHVLALLDALGLDEVRLVGHDWGAWVGFGLCLQAPHRFSRFVALNKNVVVKSSRNATVLVHRGD